MAKNLVSDFKSWRIPSSSSTVWCMALSLNLSHAVRSPTESLRGYVLSALLCLMGQAREAIFPFLTCLSQNPPPHPPPSPTPHSQGGQTVQLVLRKKETKTKKQTGKELYLGLSYGPKKWERQEHTHTSTPTPPPWGSAFPPVMGKGNMLASLHFGLNVLKCLTLSRKETALSIGLFNPFPKLIAQT